MSDSLITSWTQFQVPLTSEDSIQSSTFEPLLPFKADFHDAFYGRIAENGAFVLLIVWNKRAAYDAFTTSIQHGELATNLAKQSSSDLAATTKIIDFGKVAYWWRLGVNTEFRTVYFPAPTSSQTRDAVTSLKGLVLTMGMGIDGSKAHMSPYRGVPTCGWIEGTQTWGNQDVSACIWCHVWKDKVSEETFKTTERRVPQDGESFRPLSLEAFEQDLKALGAVGWEDVHVDFERVQM
ncbi:hypothetical protein GGS26DRAFT_589298 [Hypomontagnella submonticulosa]|nr:hypothetical protein GGS26DRAFT_589298 [Hypomontagnella submonticulosa]